MLKKSLIALAIASVAGSVSAANILTPENWVSIQGVTASDTEVELNAAEAPFYKVDADGKLVADDATTVKGQLDIQLNAQYSKDDLVTLQFNGARIASGEFNSVTVQLADVVWDIEDSKVVFAAGLDLDAEYDNDGVTEAKYSKPVSVGSMTLGVLSQDANTVNMRVTDLTFNQKIQFKDGDDVNIGPEQDVPAALRTTVGGILSFDGLKLNVNDILNSGSASVTYSAKTGQGTSVALDTSGENTRVLFRAANQFEINVAERFENTVDVNEERKLFVGTAGDANEETNASQVKFSVLNFETAPTLSDGETTNPRKDKFAFATTLNNAEYTVNGLFGFLGESDEDGLIESDELLAITTGEHELFENKLVVKTTGADVVAKLTLPNDFDATIPHQKFTGSAKLTFANNKTLTQDVANVGEWKLNGAEIHVPYMPFRAGFSPIVNVSNTSSQDGDIEVIVYAKNDNAWVKPQSYQLDITAKAQAQTDITAALRAQGIEGDVAFDIIVNAPKDAVHANALYFHNGDRAVINTVKKN